MLHINIVLLILLILIILLIFSYALNPEKTSMFNQQNRNYKNTKNFNIIIQEKMNSKKSSNIHSQCTLHSCGTKGIDTVSDPAYNMKQIIKQSILLEEHLVQPKKRCRDCISKHFIHINGLHEEALWLANENCNKYPFLAETTGFYSDQFDEWLNSYDDEKTIMKIASKLRDIRKKLVSKYYFNDDQNTEDTVLIKKNYVKLNQDPPIKIIENNPTTLNLYDKIY